MAVSLPEALGGYTERGARSPVRRRLDAARSTVHDVTEFIGELRCFTVGFERRAMPMVLIGLMLAAWDILVPVVGSRAVDAMAGQRPFEEVALLILGLAALIWIPHGNLFPYLIELYDVKRFRVRLLGRVAVGSLRMTLLNASNPRRLATGELARGDAQPILVEARENIGKITGRFVRELPAAIRGLAVLGLLAWMVPMFFPFLMLAAGIDLWITHRMGRTLKPHFRARQDAENAQRRMENEILAEHFGKDLDERQVDAILAPYRARVADRIDKEIAAEAPVLGYKLRRDLVANASNVTSWIVGAWLVVVAGNPIGSFLFFIAWSSRAGELFGVIMNMQQEMMKARRSLRQLTDLTGAQPAAALIARDPS